MQKVSKTEIVNPVEKLIPNHIYQFKKPFDAYFCMDGRVQIIKSAICKCQMADSVSATLYFYGSDKNLPFEAACYISILWILQEQKQQKWEVYDAASLCSLAPSPRGLTNDDEVGVQSADGVSDSHVRVQLPPDRRANKFDRGFSSVDNGDT